MTGADSLLERLVALSAGLPATEVGTHYRQPALLVSGKAFVSVKNGDTYVLHLPLEHKEMLLTTAPHIYHVTDHFNGWPSLMVRPEAISDAELELRLREAWQFRAPRNIAPLLAG
jgi:hypothetical protein